jgi:hypothetical protein
MPLGLRVTPLSRSGSPHVPFTTRWVGEWHTTISQCPEPVGRSTGPRWMEPQGTGMPPAICCSSSWKSASCISRAVMP